VNAACLVNRGVFIICAFSIFFTVSMRHVIIDPMPSKKATA